MSTRQTIPFMSFPRLLTIRPQRVLQSFSAKRQRLTLDGFQLIK